MKQKVFVLFSFLFFVGISAYSQNGIYVTKNISCNGGSDGELIVNANFGTGPYTYLWNTGSTQKTISGLLTGIYSVTVTDALLADTIFSYNLEEPSPITTSYAIINNSNWTNPNGSVDITAGGGTGWFTYELIDSTTNQLFNQTSNIFNNLYSGSYFVTITDVNGCQLLDTIVVGEDAGIVTLFNIDFTACYRDSAPISIQPNFVASNLPAEIYFPTDTVVIVETLAGPLYITNTLDTLNSISYYAYPGKNLFKIVTNDNQGFRYSWEVLEAKTPITLSWTHRNITCYNGNDGEINAYAEGSYEAFLYNITGPNSYSNNGSFVQNLQSGTYIINVQDSTGCLINQSLTLSQPIAPKIHFDTESTYCSESEDGKASVEYVQNLLTPITYLWSNGRNTDQIDSLMSGWYNVFVTDNNGCSTNDSVFVSNGDEICIPNLMTPNNDGHNDVLDISFLCYYSEVYTKILDKTGKVFFESSDCSTSWDGRDISGKLVSSGSIVYAYIVINKLDGTSKEFRKTITILY